MKLLQISATTILAWLIIYFVTYMIATSNKAEPHPFLSLLLSPAFIALGLSLAFASFYFQLQTLHTWGPVIAFFVINIIGMIVITNTILSGLTYLSASALGAVIYHMFYLIAGVAINAALAIYLASSMAPQIPTTATWDILKKFAVFGIVIGIPVALGFFYNLWHSQTKVKAGEAEEVASRLSTEFQTQSDREIKLTSPSAVQVCLNLKTDVGWRGHKPVIDEVFIKSLLSKEWFLEIMSLPKGNWFLAQNRICVEKDFTGLQWKDVTQIGRGFQNNNDYGIPWGWILYAKDDFKTRAKEIALNFFEKMEPMDGRSLGDAKEKILNAINSEDLKYFENKEMLEHLKENARYDSFSVPSFKLMNLTYRLNSQTTPPHSEESAH